MLKGLMELTDRFRLPEAAKTGDASKIVPPPVPRPGRFPLTDPPQGIVNAEKGNLIGIEVRRLDGYLRADGIPKDIVLGLWARGWSVEARLEFYRDTYGLPIEKAKDYWRRGVDIDAAIARMKEKNARATQ